MNKLMAEFRNKEHPSKKKEYVEYSNIEWENLSLEKNLIDEMLRNIITEVEADKGGLEWQDRRAYQLNPSQRDTDLAPTVYVQAAEKFAMMKVLGVNSEVGVNFSVEVDAQGHVDIPSQSQPLVKVGGCCNILLRHLG